MPVRMYFIFWSHSTPCLGLGLLFLDSQDKGANQLCNLGGNFKLSYIAEERNSRPTSNSLINLPLPLTTQPYCGLVMIIMIRRRRSILLWRFLISLQKQSQRILLIDPYKDLYANVHSSFLHSSPNGKNPNMHQLIRR